ncbi:MAG: hypothetical protein H8E09_00200 [Gammaproteobacteria bacterium]|nr:hypothetical protein [Gammaproteobacteria bacterium]MBL7003964.1 hypothetical protein [Gammaproteobacteria bacterium]
MKEQKDKHSNLSNLDADTTSNTRRRFIQGSTSIPVIMAVQSRSVWGAGCSVSGTLSGNLSNNNSNPNNCDAPITGRSPGYWASWEGIYTLIKGKTFNDLSWQEKKELKKTGQGDSINVLYNWSLAANGNTDVRINLHPTDNYGNISDSGIAISDTPNNQVLRHLVAACLSAAHPDSQFPYPTSRWSVEYMLDRYLSTDVSLSAELDSLLRSFFSNHIDAPMRILGMRAKPAFNWAKEYLKL